MKKTNKKPIAIFLITLAVLYVIIYIVPKVTGAMVSTYTVEYGELQISDKTECCIIRDEDVYTSEVSGKANRYIEEGTLVRAGTSIMEVTGSLDKEPDRKYDDMLSRLGKHRKSTSDFSVSYGGIVSYYADGYEGRLTPDNIEKISYDMFSELDRDAVISLSRDNIVKSEPVFKITDRTTWYMLCFVDKNHIDRYEEGSSIDVHFGEDNVTADIVRADVKDGHGRIILATDYYYEKFAKERFADISLVTYSERGLLIETDSITEKKGVRGVYVKGRGENYGFVPVLEYAENDGKSLVADTFFYDENGEYCDTVEIYDEVLKEPEK